MQPGYPPPGGFPPGYGNPMPPPPGVYGQAGADAYGRDTLLANRPTQSADAYALQNKRMLRVKVGAGNPEFYARAGSMVAYQGGVTFDGNTDSWGGQVMRGLTGVALPLMKVGGAGDVYLANQAQDVHILTLSGDSFIVDKDNLLAFSGGLRWDIVRVDSTQTVGGLDSYNIELSGHGTFVVCTPGAPLVMRVTPQNYYFADADAVVGWSSGLQTQMQANTVSTGVWRPRGNTGESWQVQFSGDGFVIIQPSEVLPPYNALGGAGLLQQVMGPGTAFRGNVLGNLQGPGGLGGLGGNFRR